MTLSEDGSASLAREFFTTMQARREEIVSLCERLVAARSENPPGDTRQVAAVVAGALGSFGVLPRIVKATDTMPCVVAEMDSGRPGPHLVLNVHMDTMPPGPPELWAVPAYQLSRVDGRLYGLGMGNMKGAVAAMVHAARLLAENPEHWCGRVTFTAVSDEVVFGENGAAHLLRTDPGVLGDAMICGEGPGFERLSIAEKGVLWLEMSVTAQPGHSSAVRPGASATARLAEAIVRIDRLNGMRVAAPAELHGLFSEDDPGLALSANVGTVTAGTFVGQIATDGRAEIDLRLPPGMDMDRAEALVHETIASIPGLTIRRIKGWNPNWTSPDAPLVSAWRAARSMLDGAAVTVAIRLPASDASRWRLGGTPALCYGPQPGLSSGVDDYAQEDEVLRCAALYAAAATEYLRPTAVGSI